MPTRCRILRRLAVLGGLVAATYASSASAADAMDPVTERLVLQPAGLPPGQTCQSIAADPAGAGAGLRPQDLACRPNDAAFANMMADLGFAIAPTGFYPARTTGVGGFQVSLEASFTRLNTSRSVANPDGSRTSFWQEGTRGDGARNTSPDSLLQIYAIKARKGLPLGFEIAGSFGTIASTPLYTVGGDLRWAFLEGFRTGALGYLPDLSVGAGVRTVTGTSRFSLVTVGIDARASKAIALADSAQIIPGIGFQRLMVFADSNVVDATPNVDALDQCGYAGANPATGAPICRNKLPNGQDANGDLANTFTFDKARSHRNRALASLSYRYEIMWLGSQIAVDLSDPESENPGLVGSRQWTLSFEGGVFF